jgi:hypothetical protein
MNLVEIFLPLHDNEGAPFPRALFETVEQELTEHFGGVTSYPRAPAKGLWRRGDENQNSDNLVVFEVMARSIDQAWWSEYRTELEQLFRQERMLIRTHDIRVL